MRFKTIFFISIFFCIFSTFGQQSLSGKTIDQFFDSAIGITIFDQDTTKIGQSDLNGYFQIKLPKKTDKLIFAGVGYEWATITISKECENLEIILFLDSTYDFMSPKKVDRLRMKEFEKLTELHSQAYQKGLFKTEKPCVRRKFEPYFTELDEIRRQQKLTKKHIKTKFKELKIGDSIKVPTQTWSAYTDGTDFGCLISGMVIEKNKKKSGYNLIIKVTDNLCEKDKATYNGNLVEIGDSITHNMKYYKIITE
ncbi:carboxypeptidase-like regulatory domain-containing protein [Bizionia myxarmorum]|uniref:Carboxypeptidase-like regulatory domain-containing protein n=1 Tax=Bizionia myxarmorum TaxID=291186 RepID=A0A5D0R5A5_9FLAO|nr:carboxypeptidase-like regulatory domain-containing protein [Bizionia myxarmorum]TYB75848.1 carboxypeptidase-like regulatory domain-containing protein [Bizionia myxarmorum]